MRGKNLQMIERRMEKSALKTDYNIVQKYATAIKNILDKSIGSEITFSTDDTLYMDLRNRKVFNDGDNC